jgi:hypothetical protein
MQNNHEGITNLTYQIYPPCDGLKAKCPETELNVMS